MVFTAKAHRRKVFINNLSASQRLCGLLFKTLHIQKKTNFASWNQNVNNG
jgi:hypothetical protein